LPTPVPVQLMPSPSQRNQGLLSLA
jgi:hypothetical protein